MFRSQKMKDLFIAEQEKMIEEFCEKYPDATQDEIYAYMDEHCDEAMDRVNDHLADVADRRYQEAKDRAMEEKDLDNDA